MSMMYEIEKGIEMPGANHGWRGRPSKYPWLKMEIGDSFLITGNKSLRCAASKANAKYDRRFATRTVEGGVRVWRVE
jgi:hypothetical protein